ncbi:MAG: hypothetical protein PHT51_03225 [Patescibacteria group bacterium]|nr:hypothetical protein [Patescibacteria group bacterium]MDD4611113.1 hypothetical protein [Patescibacteria group bacterium]
MKILKRKKIKDLNYFYACLPGRQVFKFLNFYNKNGQSLLEIILAVAIFGLVAATITTMVLGGDASLSQGGKQTEALAYAQEGIEAVRSIRDRAWNENKYATSSVATSSGEWIYNGEGTTQTIGEFARTIAFSDVCRDISDNITVCPGEYIDPHTKKVTVRVSWVTSAGATNNVEKIAYLSNWHKKVWPEDILADFSDGTFTNTIATTTYGTGNGAVVLQEQN